MGEKTGPLSSAQGWLAGARFFGALPGYLRKPVAPEEAKRRVREWMAGREARLLDRIRRDIFEYPENVYARLLRHAGCTYGDVESLVRNEGAENALRQLRQAGVYLSVDEFKGRLPVVRGSFRMEMNTADLRSPRAAYHLPAASGGSRSSGTPVLIDLRFVNRCAGNCLLALDAWHGRDWIKGDWETPGAGARFRLTKFGMFGDPPEAWFSQIDPDDQALPSIFRWNTKALQWSSRLAGRPLPGPTAAALDNPLPVVKWLAEVLGRKQTPVLFTFPGSAVQACVSAMNHGVDISGARFLLAGEPITEARVATVRRAGAVVLPRYGTMETGAIGYGCPHGQHADDVHLLEHMHVLTQHDDALYLTDLDPYSPFLLLNVSMGDQARMEKRSCGCLWDELGLRTHLWNVRSYEKLTGNGVTFLGAEVIEILERTLPAAIGGMPTDYQLAEAEGLSGEPVLELRVHPRIGAVDESRVAALFLDELIAGSPAAAVMVRMWRDSGTMRVVREAPAVSAAGKILHLHAARGPRRS